MVYKWKLSGLYDVEAQAAGEELQRIYNERGCLDPQDIVDESRPQDAVLHPCFEWSDPVAAERWREHQAQQIVRCVITVAETESKEPVEVRAFVNVESTYQPIQVVIREGKKDALLEVALRELEAFRAKYANLSTLDPVFLAIDELEAGA